MAKEIGCLFTFDSVKRTISVYDLYTVCKNSNCGYRGEFLEKCPKCNGTNLYNYGNDTEIFISAENYAESITMEGEVDKVKNCFKIEGGDDLITATLVNCNPNGSSYIYHFTDEMISDMPDELVKKLISYNELYESKQNEYIACTNKIYELIDKELYFQTKMMPSIEIQNTSAEIELTKLINELNEVEVVNISTLSKTSADLAVKGIAKILIDPRYDVEIISSTLSNISGTTRTWNGIFKVYNTSAKDDDYVQNKIKKNVIINCNNYEKYLYQKIEKTITHKDSALESIFNITDLKEFKTELKKYALDSLTGFESSYNTILEILVENGVTDKSSIFYDVKLYEKIYKPNYDKLMAIQSEMVIRENEINTIINERDIETKKRNTIQNELDFKSYIGDLWNTFCLYLYEDVYSNSNYISDGLSNTELISKAEELFNVAKIELHKASQLQISLKVNVGNMLVDENFKPYLNNIKVGNWLRVKVNTIVYKLRLINISISGDELTDITFEFSNVTEFKNYISDVQNIISKAQNITSSYDYITHQIEQSKKVTDIVTDWRKYGLNAVEIAIRNTDNQNIVYDKHGLICRQYDDILGDYKPEQIKIINNTIAMTSNNWESVESAIGKLKYKLDGTEYEDYGVNANHVLAGKIIGGDIYSSNYSSVNKIGIHIGLNNETIQIGGDSLIYNSKDGLTITGNITATSGKIGDWNINKALYSGTNSMTSTITGTYLGIDGIRNYKDANHYVEIKNGSLISVGGTITSAIINNGNGTFMVTKEGKIIANSGTIGGWNINKDSLYKDISYTVPYAYTSDDIETMQKIIVGMIIPSDAQLSKYDLNGDGHVSTIDIVTVQRILKYGNSGSAKLVFNSNSLNEVISFSGTTGFCAEAKTKIGLNTVTTDYFSGYTINVDKVICETITCEKGASGYFTDKDGKEITVIGGIITSIISDDT